MKRCPECRRDYYDDTLSFCLEDGSPLVQGSVSAPQHTADEPATAILHSTAVPGEAPTREQFNTTDETTVLPSGITGEPKRGFDNRLLAIPFLLAIILGGAVFGVYRYYAGRGTTAGTLGRANMKITRVTATGKATHAAISPDGNYIVHSMADAGKQSLWVRQTATGSNVQIVPPADVVYQGITFSHDGNYVFLVSREVGAGTGYLARVPVLGGTPVKLVTDVDSPVTFSPDGQQMAFIRQNPPKKTSGLWLANADGSSDHRIAMRQSPESFAGGPAWSPDGKDIACAIRGIESGVAYLTVVAVSVADGDQKAFTSRRWHSASIGRLAWSGENSLIMNVAEQHGVNNAQIWHLSYPGGEAQPLTHDLNNYEDVGLTRDSAALVTVQSERQTNVWIAPDGDARRARQLTSGKGNDGENICWTPQGKIVYDSKVSGTQDIWVMDASGADQKQLTNDPHSDREPTISPDGRYIVFISARSGTAQVWRMNADGSNTKQLSNVDSRGTRPIITPDGKWVIFGGFGNAWKVPIDGGEAERFGKVVLAIAPDGHLANWVIEADTDRSSRQLLGIGRLGDDSPPQSFEMPQTTSFSAGLQWRTDGRAVFYVDTPGGVSNIWSYPLDGGKPKQITNFQSDSIFRFAFAPDGKQLAVTRGTNTSDVVLIKDFK